MSGTQSQKYLWCSVPPDMRGNVITSLAALRSQGEGLANQAAKKYEGREALTQTLIKPLDCKWDEVIFLSPYHPHEIYTSYRDAGFQVRPMKFFQIPLERLENKIIAWLPVHRSQEERASGILTSIPFSPEDLPVPFPDEQKKAYREAMTNGIRPLLYGASPHLVVAAKPSLENSMPGIEVTGLEIIDWSKPVELGGSHQSMGNQRA